jgi:RNA recognition motif-containing protein
LNGFTFNDRKLIVALRVREDQKTKAEKEELLRQQREALPKPIPDRAYREILSSANRTVYISNINFAIAKENIIEMCEDLVGPNLVENVRFPLDKESGAPRGFCYVVFREEDTVSRAIEALDGVPVLGRELRVVKYTPRLVENR